MSVIKKMFDDGSKFIKTQLALIRNENSKEYEEIKKMEGKLKKLEKTDKESESKNFWSVKGIFKFRLIWLLIVFVGYLWFKSLNIIYLILTAFILSIAMEAIINLFERIRLRRWLSIAISYIFLILFVLPWLFLVGLFLVDLFWQLVGKLISWAYDLKNFIEATNMEVYVQSLMLPEYIKTSIIENILPKLNFSPESIELLFNNFQQNISKILWTGSSILWSIFVAWWNLLVKIKDIVFNLWIVLTLSVLFSTQKDSVVNFLSWLGWKKWKEYMKIKFERIYKKLWLWLKWQLILCACIFSVTVIALYVLRLCWLEVPKIWSLATIAWLTEIIPYIWPILWGIPTIFMVLLHNWFYAALIMLVIIAFIQWLENNVLIPLIMNKTIWVNPVTIFISMIIWWLIMWFVWIFLAVPIAVIITMFLDDKNGK